MPKTLRSKPKADGPAKCRYVYEFADGQRCEKDATGDLVVIQQPPGRLPWPPELTVAHCNRHGQLAVSRAPSLAPGTVLEFREYGTSPTPKKGRKKALGAQE